MENQKSIFARSVSKNSQKGRTTHAAFRAFKLSKHLHLDKKERDEAEVIENRRSICYQRRVEKSTERKDRADNVTVDRVVPITSFPREIEEGRRMWTKKEERTEKRFPHSVPSSKTGRVERSRVQCRKRSANRPRGEPANRISRVLPRPLIRTERRGCPCREVNTCKTGGEREHIVCCFAVRCTLLQFFSALAGPITPAPTICAWPSAPLPEPDPLFSRGSTPRYLEQSRKQRPLLSAGYLQLTVIPRNNFCSCITIFVQRGL